MRGVNESDHNTILLELELTKIQKHKVTKATIWNLKAPVEKFAAFRQKLERSTDTAHEIMSNKDKPITDRYAAWEKLLYKAAISTIGKSTNKSGKTPKTSDEDYEKREETS